MKTTTPKEYITPDLEILRVEAASHLANQASPNEVFIPEELEGEWENS